MHVQLPAVAANSAPEIPTAESIEHVSITR
jgi:hypothetical protein